MCSGAYISHSKKKNLKFSRTSAVVFGRLDNHPRRLVDDDGGLRSPEDADRFVDCDPINLREPLVAASVDPERLKLPDNIGRNLDDDDGLRGSSVGRTVWFVVDSRACPILGRATFVVTGFRDSEIAEVLGIIFGPGTADVG
jgi:hypothetical protein